MLLLTDHRLDFFLQGHLQYDSIIGDASPDLRPFKEHGGKMITWQGLADQLIMPQGTQLYYDKIQNLDRSVHDFYRQFYSPGVGHCGGGIGVTPTHQLEQLRAWVENGTAPDLLQAGSAFPVNASSDLAVGSNNVRFQALCPYPQVSKYSGADDPTSSGSYVCTDAQGWYDFRETDLGGNNCVGGPGWYGGRYGSTAR